MNKGEIRKEKISQRKSIKNREQKDKKIAERLMDSVFYKNAKTIMVYISYNSEADTRLIINDMLRDGKILCAPVCIDKENMVARKFSSPKELGAGAFGILEPRGEEIKNIDLVIVPGVAFNKNLHRIGYGAGYYDRFLERVTTVKCGLFYEMQKADFTEDKTDKELDYIITEEKIYKKEN